MEYRPALSLVVPECNGMGSNLRRFKCQPFGKAKRGRETQREGSQNVQKERGNVKNRFMLLEKIKITPTVDILNV